ncbi:MAG: phosphatidylserine/phosphatidylglycerophosphate/cardiolipin synthase family protein [Clostridia bacterium]|nr:phosphatidylserine/phosphatidylglycerophosphate/cardiolipin synthase family protein [Clostridia bacterium]
MNAETAGTILYDDPIKYYNAMLDDILAARKYVFIEMYKFGHQIMGVRFRDALTAVARAGVEVKLLIDSWGGSGIPDDFFAELLAAGGEVRFFQKIKINIDFFTRSHRRNHRKLLIIDDLISYIGSSNITDYNLIWRESMLRLYGDIAVNFKKIFYQDFKIYNSYIRYRRHYTRIMRCQDMEILRDVPSITRQKIKKRYEYLIRQAKRSVTIESPYFLPGFYLRKALIDAVARGVEVRVIIPRHSDVRMVNLLHGRYLEMLHRHNIQFLYYTIHNLHAKLLLVDEKIFCLGSPNFDYRSFRYMHEILLTGHDAHIAGMISEHIIQTMRMCEPFDYDAWMRRPRIQRFFEWLILPLRHLL